jgi:molybdopterin synthase catalytic subunit
MTKDNMTIQKKVVVQTAPFDIKKETRLLTEKSSNIGAIVTFTGIVRELQEEQNLECLELEHYSGMTEQSLHAIVEEATERWSLTGLTLIHRVGKLKPKEDIVLVVIATSHREAAFKACEFLMDYLKTRAPFWKKCYYKNGTTQWVAAKLADAEAASRW